MANQMADKLAESAKSPTGKYKEVTKEEATQLADKGEAVVAAWKNNNGPDHVATVRPTGVQGDKPEDAWPAKGPLFSNVGPTNALMHESSVFPKAARVNGEIHYYARK